MKTRLAICFLTTLCGIEFAARLCAQDAVFILRNGANTAYCGPLGGPSIVNRFSTPDPTQDTASVSEPGNTNWSSSGATSQLDVTPSPSGITIHASGSVMRGPLLVFGVAATADARDNWEFTLTEPARFTWNVLFSGTSADPSAPTHGFNFGGFTPGSIIVDPGTAPEAFGGGMTGPGTLVRRASGRMMPGRYLVSFGSRVEGNNTHPYSGSFNTSIALELGPDVPLITKIQIEPSGLKLEWTDLPPKQFTVETASSLTDDSWAAVSGMVWPIPARSVVLPPPSTFPAFYRVKAQ